MHNRIDQRPLPALPALLLASACALAGCGNKGPLTLPPRDVAAAPQPVAAAAPAKAAADNNSPPSRASQ